jgi:hypothetical protein
MKSHIVYRPNGGLRIRYFHDRTTSAALPTWAARWPNEPDAQVADYSRFLGCEPP